MTTASRAPRYVCLHGHFYQPPRENPWLDEIEIEDSAHPYHDWNTRITDECYAPNTAARLVNDKNEIIDIVNNFARMSFNVGPTLLSWLERARPEVYAAMLAADRESCTRFGGHGNAIAQGYNHTILPLATRAEKQLQIRWGIADFRHRFQREPEGFWLPETGVDLETLTLLAEAGIRFVILSPFQARRVRPVGDGPWTDVSGGHVNPRQPYICRLPPDGGRAIAVFFYDAPVSRAIAFEGLLSKGELLVQRLHGAFVADDATPQLVHVATDGESYGHHHRFGEMALAFALHHLERLVPAELINYGAFLERHPPTQEVEIVERSSWSCFHGVERWRGDCGCHGGRFPSWRQRWRGPLREALDWLAAAADRVFHEESRRIFADPALALRDYVEIMLQPTDDRRTAFLRTHAARRLDDAAQLRAWRLLEMQRHRHLMYTSCGWFFDDISGLETVQILKYASRALQLLAWLGAEGLEAEFIRRLQQAPSNLPQFQHGGAVYERFIQPLQTDLPRVVAHYAISSLVEEQPQASQLYAYRLTQRDYQRTSVGDTTLALGHVVVEHPATTERVEMLFAVLHGGGQLFDCVVHPSADEQAYARLKAALVADEPLTAAQLAQRLAQWGSRIYTLKDLFLEERRKVLRQVIQDTIDQYETVYRELYTQHRALLGSLNEAGLPLPSAFRVATQHVLQERMEELARRVPVDPNALAGLHVLRGEAAAVQVELDVELLETTVGDVVVRLLRGLQEQPADAALMELAAALLEAATAAQITPQLWTAQNLFFARYRRRDQASMAWPAPVQAAIQRLGRALQFADAPALTELSHAARP